MAKLSKLVKSLQVAQVALEEIEAAGIDVNKLIGISNTQEPQAKVIQGALGLAMSLAQSASFNKSNSKKKKTSPKVARKSLKAG